MKCAKKTCLREAAHTVSVDLGGEHWITASGDLRSWQEFDLCKGHVGEVAVLQADQGLNVRVLLVTA